MSTILLSVVMPVYNVAAYLPRCLDSLAAQTRPIDELIVVDDGSTDACPQILAEYAARLPQMRVIRQDNGGLSAARNTGMRHARGKYLAFVDSDDFVAPQMYELMLESAERNATEILLCNATYHYEGREVDRLIYPTTPASETLAGKQWLLQHLQHGRLLHMVWMHLYLRAFLEKHQFAFVPGLIHEDVVWTTEALLAARRVRYEATPLYYYRIPVRRFSAEKNKLRLAAIISSSIYNAQRLFALAQTCASEPDLQRQLNAQAVDGAFTIFHKIAKIDDAEWVAGEYREVRSSGLFPLLWANAESWKQRRRIARNYLKCLFKGGARA